MVLYAHWGMNVIKTFLFLYLPDALLVNLASFGYLYLSSQVKSDMEFQFYVYACA